MHTTTCLKNALPLHCCHQVYMQHGSITRDGSPGEAGDVVNPTLLDGYERWRVSGGAFHCCKADCGWTRSLCCFDCHQQVVVMVMWGIIVT
jgi:hypothetical protein